jgi:precorrin-2 dehydrogenase/sirohydrochlorin ferrochelatase
VIPLFHDFTGERVLVFGGGTVGARKARRFAREAEVIVVSPEFADADFGGAERVRAAPDADAVEAWLTEVDPALAVAATDSESLNAAVERAARERGLLVNRTDTHGDRDPGSVVVPATVRDDPVVVAISTGASSPALSKHLRERLEPEISGAGSVAELTAELRDRLQREGVPPERRRAVVRDAVKSDRVWKALDRCDTNVEQATADLLSNVTGDPE